MTKSLGNLLVAAALLAAAGCTPDGAREAAPQSEAERREALEQSAFGGLSTPLDRAGAVEQLTIERKRELDAALE